MIVQRMKLGLLAVLSVPFLAGAGEVRLRANNGDDAADGYRYVNIDDGWCGGRDKNGRHTTNPDRFPNGFKPVADQG